MSTDMKDAWKPLAALVAIACVIAIGVARPRVVAMDERVKERFEVYVLPPPKILVAASLGHRAALADYLWADVLVTQGLRMGQKRPFLTLYNYLDAISTLDPLFRPPYRLADTLIAYQMNDPNREESMRLARKYMERGLRNRPNDAELWLNYGDYLAYLGPGGLKDPKEQDQWREDGAKALGKAIELFGEDERVFRHGIAGFTLLSQAGKTDAAIRFLERAYAMTDDDEVKAGILKRLQQLRKGRVASEQFRAAQAFSEYWRDIYPFVSRAVVLVSGPRRTVWRCAGDSTARGRDCVDSWHTWRRQALRRGQTPEQLLR